MILCPAGLKRSAAIAGSHFKDVFGGRIKFSGGCLASFEEVV
jgi:hypothetical protein